MMTAVDDDSVPAAEPIPLSAAERAKLAPALSSYLGVQAALAADDHAAAVLAADALVAAVATVELPAGAQDAWTAIATPLTGHGTHVARSANLEGARGGFEPLSLAIEQMLARFGNPLNEPVRVAFCPMAMGNAGARWVQQGETIDNAYFGASMRTCGDIEETIAPGTYLDTTPAPAAPRAGHTGHQH
jgi:Cu(I)/Ag(I) efflux system membrane fusion protein